MAPDRTKGDDLSEILFNCQELAAEFGKPHTYVTAMRRAGYTLKYEALGKTTREHALTALEKAPEFRAHHYLSKGWERLPKLLAVPTNPAPLDNPNGADGKEIDALRHQAFTKSQGLLHRAPELAKELGVPTTFVRDMHRGGFPMPGGRATAAWALAWLEKHPDFSPAATRRPVATAQDAQ